MKREQPAWIDKQLYPFTSHWIEIDGDYLHYIDEGQGDVIVFAHGTPEWSFGYRDMIKGLRSNFRCIAIDMLGFGLSEKKTSSDYTCQAHARRFEAVINKLNLKNISIVANDFGGGISLSYAINHPENVKLIALFNTWMWSLKDDKHYSAPTKFFASWIGKSLYLNFNAPVNIIMPLAYGNRKLLTPHIHQHYKNALRRGERTGAYAFAKELMNASDWWQSLWERADVLQDKTMIFFWGFKDKFIPPADLKKWQARFPKAEVITFEDAGHFVQEEKSKEMIKKLAFAMKSTPTFC